MRGGCRRIYPTIVLSRGQAGRTSETAGVVPGLWTNRKPPECKDIVRGFDGERYRCAVCNATYYLDYDEMRTNGPVRVRGSAEGRAQPATGGHVKACVEVRSRTHAVAHQAGVESGPLARSGLER